MHGKKRPALPVIFGRLLLGSLMLMSLTAIFLFWLIQDGKKGYTLSCWDRLPPGVGQALEIRGLDHFLAKICSDPDLTQAATVLIDRQRGDGPLLDFIPAFPAMTTWYRRLGFLHPVLAPVSLAAGKLPSGEFFVIAAMPALWRWTAGSDGGILARRLGDGSLASGRRGQWLVLAQTPDGVRQILAAWDAADIPLVQAPAPALRIALVENETESLPAVPDAAPLFLQDPLALPSSSREPYRTEIDVRFLDSEQAWRVTGSHGAPLPLDAAGDVRGMVATLSSDPAVANGAVGAVQFGQTVKERVGRWLDSAVLRSPSIVQPAIRSWVMDSWWRRAGNSLTLELGEPLPVTDPAAPVAPALRLGWAVKADGDAGEAEAEFSKGLDGILQRAAASSRWLAGIGSLVRIQPLDQANGAVLRLPSELVNYLEPAWLFTAQPEPWAWLAGSPSLIPGPAMETPQLAGDENSWTGRAAWSATPAWRQAVYDLARDRLSMSRSREALVWLDVGMCLLSAFPHGQAMVTGDMDGNVGFRLDIADK